jgi:hypothetical protein
MHNPAKALQLGSRGPDCDSLALGVFAKEQPEACRIVLSADEAACLRENVRPVSKVIRRMRAATGGGGL